jgi:type II secretory pathway pseudopilin PulG
MKKSTHRSRGFTLIASLLMMVLLSGIALGLMYLVSGTSHVGSNDLESNVAFYAAESGMEKMTADIAALYQGTQSPTPAQIEAVATTTPGPPDPTMMPNVTYAEAVTFTPDANGNPITTSGVISTGPDAGLTAIMVPLTLTVTATRPSGANANITRGVEVALIPVFQFGVFSSSDLSYFAGPQFDFEGRVHTNGNLFLAANNGPLYLDGKVTAYGQIVRDRLANNYNGGGYTGNVYVPTTSGGCDALTPSATCLNLTYGSPGDGSWGGSYPPAPPALGNNGNWVNVSTNTFAGMIGNNQSTGVTPLSLPFVQGNPTAQIQIIRKTPSTGADNVGTSREYNKASIRILLADTQADLHPDRPGNDGQDIQLTNGAAPGNPGAGLLIAVNGVGNVPLGWANTNLAYDPKSRWVPPNIAGWTGKTTWPLIDGWLRVEYQDTAGNWHGVTTEWLGLGFARGILPPAAPGANAVNPSAILILQEQGDKDQNGIINGVDNDVITGALNTTAQFSWYPINFFDPREGYPRDSLTGTGLAGSQCYANGVMNAVELDVGNLNRWLTGAIAGSGTLVAYVPQNGYVLYFSDRRGMQADPNPPFTYTSPSGTNGESGLEDVINSASATGTPNGTLEPTSYYAFSPEDVDDNLLLDNWGAASISVAFPPVAGTAPFTSTNCLTQAYENKITGARHVLRLVDGNLNNVPVRPDNGLGGFTVASENPLYVLGNYNTNNTDPFWANTTITTDIPHSAASVIADTVTLLSNNWSDLNGMTNAEVVGNRVPTATYYRMAVSAGKNINFPQPAAGNGIGNDFGTDGGVHNFLRYIENWGGVNLNYRGSLVSLYYSQYATGTFKCCTLVYGAPNRNYFFDWEFLNPADLPPGTPELQDVVNLTYWQNFQAY